MSTMEPVTPAGGDGLLRVRLDFAYDGTDFSGWAAQPGLRTVEAELSQGLTRILRAQSPVRLTVAGRTDAGVHARGAVAHADVDPLAWELLAVRSGRPAQVGALNRVRGVLRRHDTVVHRRPLDVAAMHEASQALLGLQDFAAFCKRREGATTVRTLLELGWTREPDGTVVGTVVADAFCHSMVRSLVGVVVPVGEGRRPVSWPLEVLTAARRDAAVVVMPPHGLSLEEVAYPGEDELALRARETRARRPALGGPA